MGAAQKPKQEKKFRFSRMRAMELGLKTLIKMFFSFI